MSGDNIDEIWNKDPVTTIHIYKLGDEKFRSDVIIGDNVTDRTEYGSTPSQALKKLCLAMEESEKS